MKYKIRENSKIVPFYRSVVRTRKNCKYFISMNYMNCLRSTQKKKDMNTMQRTEVKGICTYCKDEIPKNSRSIMNHLSKCEVKNESKNKKYSKSMILLIEGKYSPEYWLVIKAKPDITMKRIDKFIKDIWIECCGHLSSFSDGHSDIGMNRKLDQVFEKGYKIDYIYDYGTSTEISLSLLEEIEDFNDKGIQVLLRNKEIDYKCSYCNKKAEAICPFCADEDEGLLCSACIKNHKCIQDEGEDVLLPLVNSPRAGVCGYTGYIDKAEVKKYFPNEII